MPRSGRVLEALVPAVLEQKVTGREAWRAWRWLVRRYGEPAPGPAGLLPDGLRVPPAARTWAGSRPGTGTGPGSTWPARAPR